MLIVTVLLIQHVNSLNRMIVTILYTSLGSGLSDPLTVTPDVGIASPSSVTQAQLLAGVDITVDNTATILTITSTGVCSMNSTLSLLTTTSTSTIVPPTTTSTTTSVVVNNCGIVLLGSGGQIYTYNYNTNIATLLTTLIVSPDVAITYNKLWVYDNQYIYEYNITINPWTISSLSRIIEYNVYYNPYISGSQAGLTAINNTTLLIGGHYICSLDITTTSAGITMLFALPTGCTVAGDIYYNWDGTYYITYYDIYGSPYIGHFSSTGTVLNSSYLSGSIYPLGLFSNNNNLYLTSGTDIYLVDQSSLVITLDRSVSGITNIAGADQSCRITTSTTTTLPITTTTSTTSGCIRPTGLPIQQSLVTAWGTSSSSLDFHTYSVTDVCTQFNTFLSTDISLSNYLVYWLFETDAVAVGHKLWLNFGWTNCDVVPDGNYWYVDHSFPLGSTLLKTYSVISIISVASGIITAITPCIHLITTTTTTTLFPPTTTTTTTNPLISTTTTTTTLYTDCYGLLYNWYTVNNTSPVNNSNAHVPSNADWTNLYNYLTSISAGNEGGLLKEIGTSHWSSPNTGATNAYGFTALPGGYRNVSGGGFSDLTLSGYWWTSEIYNSTYPYCVTISYSSSGMVVFSYVLAAMGMSLRLVVDSPNVIVDGTHAVYIGNDGKRYPCVLINGVWWMAVNLAETLYQNGSSIPEVQNGTSWVNTITGALCAYNNNWSYACAIEPTTTTTSSSSTTSTSSTSTSSTSSTSTTSTTSTSSSTTTTTTTLYYIPYCSVITNDTLGHLYNYAFSTNSVKLLASLSTSPNVAMTDTKLWIYNSFFVIREYNITLSPWSITFNRNINFSSTYYGSGFTAINNTTLVMGNSSVYQLDITTTTAVGSLIFALPAGASIAGSIYYNSSTTHYIITYFLSGHSYIGEFTSSGAMWNSAPIPSSGAPNALFSYGGYLYIIDGSNAVYLVNSTTLALTYIQSIPSAGGTNGATQTNICLNSGFVSTTSTTSTSTSTSTSSTTTTTTTVAIITCSGLVVTPVTVNGINVTSSHTGSVSFYIPGYSSCNPYIVLPPYSVWVGEYGSFTYTFNFSLSVNNIILIITATGYTANENFIITTDSGTPAIAMTSGCYTTITGNEIISGLGAPPDDGHSHGGGGGMFVITNSIPFTSMTISGAGGSNGSLLGICSSSIIH